MAVLSKKDLITLLNAKNREILSLMSETNSLRDTHNITYSKNVFLPLTDICRNECGYCTFRKNPDSADARILMKPDEVLSTIREADSFGCKEALFTFGEQPDQTDLVMSALDDLGFGDMLEYLYFLCSETIDKTGLLPHSNPGILRKNELKMLREVNASMGLMLETSSNRIMETIAHKKSPGKEPKLRIETIENAGKLKIPFTTGLLIGIGETISERVESLIELRRIQDKYGHIQEIIIQNFKTKPGIPMEGYREPSLAEMIKMVSVTKLMFPDVSVQVPPNLNKHHSQIFLMAGADDWGGVSPLTPDYVNPEAPWPEIEELKMITEELGFKLKERLPVYHKYVLEEFLDPRILEKIEEIEI
jgi:7,8-didemethyl-8-hydroxy-5-deazariboflavin synthase